MQSDSLDHLKATTRPDHTDLILLVPFLRTDYKSVFPAAIGSMRVSIPSSPSSRRVLSRRSLGLEGIITGVNYKKLDDNNNNTHIRNTTTNRDEGRETKTGEALLQFVVSLVVIKVYNISQFVISSHTCTLGCIKTVATKNRVSSKENYPNSLYYSAPQDHPNSRQGTTTDTLVNHHRNRTTDDALEYSKAQSLAHSLHKEVMDANSNNKNQPTTYRSALDASSVLRIASLCRSLEETLQEYDQQALCTAVSKLTSDLAPSLPRIIRIVAVQTKLDPHVREATLISSLNIVRRVGKQMPKSMVAFTYALLQLLEPSLELSNDIRVGAACAVVAFLTETDKMEQELLRLVDENESALASVFNTVAASPEIQSNNNNDNYTHLMNCLKALEMLSRVPLLKGKLFQRRSTVQAIHQNLVHTNTSIRSQALALCELALTYFAFCPVVRTPNLQQDHTNMLTEALTRASLEEQDTNVQLTMIESLQRVALVVAKNFSRFSSQMIEILKTFRIIATVSIQDATTVADGAATSVVPIKASLSYLQVADKLPLTEETMIHVAGFLASPYDNVRLVAIRTLNEMTFWDPPAAIKFIRCTNLLCLMTDSLGQGRMLAERMETLVLCQQMLFDKRVHPLICQHEPLFDMLIRLAATGESTTDRRLFSKSVDILLDLLTQPDILPVLKGHKKIVTWLVRFSNRTTDQKLKRKLVSIIVHLSTTHF